MAAHSFQLISPGFAEKSAFLIPPPPPIPLQIGHAPCGSPWGQVPIRALFACTAPYAIKKSSAFLNSQRTTLKTFLIADARGR